MPERYPCGQCDLDFNFRIKLNRHIKKVHREEDVANAEPYFLKEGVTLSEDEKLKYFDDLKNKFDELCNKYTSYEKRFDYLQTRLRTLTQHRNKPKKKQVKKFGGSANASGSYEDIENDPTIPSGWKSSFKIMDAFGRPRKHKIYWAPNGRFCTSRREALNYMVDLQSSQQDFELMKNGLLEDGWIEDSSLPKGWLVFVTEKESRKGQMSSCKQFITADFQYYKSVKLAVKHLLLHNSDQEISKFISAQFLKNEVTPSNITWMQSDSIPYPWKAATTTSDFGAKGQVLVSPEGNVQTNLKAAVEAIEKSGEMIAADIEKLYSFMGGEKYKEEIAHNNWIKDETLPEGWMKLNKPGHAYYLSPKGETFGTRIGVLDHLKRFDDNFEVDEKPFSKKVDLVWKEDETAPKGWTSALNEESGINTGRRFKDPNGKYFFNRVDALRYMVKENSYEEEEIATMKSGLLNDGWTNEHLPEGWMVKKKTYLSPTFEMIYSMETAISLMRENGNSEEEMKKVKENSVLKWQWEGNLPEGWMVSRNEGRDWIKHYMDPSGKFFLCLPQALKHLTVRNGDQVSIDHLRPLLFEEGWCTAEFLPGGSTGGWLYKKKIEKNRFMFLSPKYDRFKNTKIFIKHMKDNNFKQEEIREFERQLKTIKIFLPKEESIPKLELGVMEDFPKIGSNSSLDWNEDETLPRGWKLAITEISSGSSVGTKYKRFLSPKGEYFGNRGDAFKSLLMDASAEQEDIEKMKTSLLEDGWESAAFLPENWLRKVSKWSKSTYLTPTGDQFMTMEKVLKYMRDNGYSVEEMDRFKENSFSTKYLDDENLPSGWKYGYAMIKSGTKIKRYLSPEGKLFNNRAVSMKYMLENKFNSEDIIKMKNGFDMDGWIHNKNLPEGWKMKPKVRKGKVQYLNPSYDTIDGSKGLLDYLEKNQFSSMQIHKTRNFVKKLLMENRNTSCESDEPKEVKFSVPQNIQSLLPSVTFSKVQVNKTKEPIAFNNLDWKDNDSLPAGWKSAYMTSALKHHNGQILKFLSPDGKFLNSRAQCLRYMLEKKDKFRSKDIDKMKRSLRKDGWRQSDCLPVNWMYRPVGRSNLFLNPKFEQIKALKNALAYMQKCGYDSLTIDNVRKGFFRVSQDPESAIAPLIFGKVEVNEKSNNSEVQDQDDASNDSFTTVKNSHQSSSSLVWNENKTLPKGWKCAFIPSTLKHHAEGSKIMKLMSPDGKFLSSRVQALKYMSENNKTFTKKNIEQMKATLSEDGWMGSNALPEGWMTKTGYHMHSFMTPEFDTLKSQKKALAFMELKKYDSATIQKAKTAFTINRSTTTVNQTTEKDERSKLVSPVKRKSSEIENESSNDSSVSESLKKKKWASKYTKGKNDKDWKEGDETLPEGWKTRIEKTSNTYQILSQSGNVFLSRAEALKYMVSNPESYNSRDIEEVKNKLHHEDWEEHSLLPEGWKLKKLIGGVVIFLSEIGSCMRTVKGARDNLKRNDISALEKFTLLVEELKPANRNELKNDNSAAMDPLSLVAVNYNHIKQEPDLSIVKKEKMEEWVSKVKVKSEPPAEAENFDPSIPPKWTIKTSSDGLDTILTSPQGKTFSSRLSAVEFLIKSKSDPQTIYNLWNTLDTEGWIIGDELLPPGWRVKFHKKIFDYKYLTREMLILHSTEEALKLVSESEDYTSENVKNFKQWSEEVSKSKPKISWNNDSSLPSGWMLSSGLPNEIIKDAKGGLFDGRKEAIDHMIKEHYSPSDIFSLWNTLHLEGWVSDEDNLPTGWKRKFFPEINKHHYLSPMMDVVKSTEALLNIVENGKEYTVEEVVKVKNWLEITK